MAQDKEDKLKKLIQLIELDQPKADFTAAIMQQIEAQGSLVPSPALHALLEKHLIESPSVDFTQNVMKGLERLDKKVVYEPLISRKTWYSISIAAALLITLVSLFGKSSQTNGNVAPLANNINHVTGQLITQINALPVLVLACLFAVSSLLLLEYFVSSKKEYNAS